MPLVIFVHGTPGDWSNFSSYFNAERLRGRARLVSVDRPGFGQSKSAVLILDLERQAAVLSPLLQLNQRARKTILVGHSLGGPIIARLAIDYPDQVDGILMLAPKLERTKWYQSMARMKLVKWTLKRANDELKDFKQELQAMEPLWQRMSAQAIVLQGGRDKLVDSGNAAFATRVLPPEQVDIWLRSDLNHFIP